MGTTYGTSSYGASFGSTWQEEHVYGWYVIFHVLSQMSLTLAFACLYTSLISHNLTMLYVSPDDEPTVELGKQYSEYGYNSFCIQTGLYAGGHDYDTEADNGVNRFGWQHHGDGYHNTTRYGEELEDDDPRKTSLSTVYRNWHPGPLGKSCCMVTSCYFFFYVTQILLFGPARVSNCQ